MAKTIYVGNLPYRCTEEDLESHFAQHGSVHSTKIVIDRETGRSRGFGFIEMDPEEADAAIQNLDNQDFQGRDLRVNEAKERTRR